MTERTISRDPVLVHLSLPAQWSQSINTARDKLHERFPEKPDSELLEIIFVTGLYTIIHR